MSGSRAPKGVPQWVVRAAMAGTTLLVVASFILSFASLTDLARRSGINPHLAWLWPLIVDGLIVVATAAIIALAGHSKGVTWFPWVLLFGGAGVSVAGNAAHAILSAHALDDGFPLAVSTAVASVPPIVLLAVTHLMVVLIANQSSAVKRVKKPKKVRDPAPVRSTRAQQPITVPRWTTTHTPVAVPETVSDRSPDTAPALV